MKMFRSINIFIVNICLISCVLASKVGTRSHSSGLQYSKPSPSSGAIYEFPRDRAKSRPFPSFTPIALITSTARNVYIPPLILNISKSAQIEFRNDGDTVRGVPTRVSQITLTLFEDIYDLHFVYYYNDAVPNNTRVGVTEDGLGNAIEHTLVFFKRAYGQYANNYPDGKVDIIFPVLVEGNIDNKAFKPFASILQDVKQPGARIIVPAKSGLFWLLEVLPHCHSYYSYPGSGLLSINNFKQYPSAIMIQLPRRCHPSISFSQFDAYSRVLNSYGQPNVRTFQVYPAYNRPIIEVSESIRVHYG